MKIIELIHGYNKNTPPGFRPYGSVVRDRVGYGLKVPEYNSPENETDRKLDELENKGLEILLEEE